MIIIIFLLFAILVAIGGVLGYQKYCDLGYGPYEYEAPADSDVAEPLCCDTTAVDTVEAIDDTQTKLEEFKNFRTNDLSAFMLHGKVKHVEESYGGNAYTLYTFNEQGKLIDVCLSGGTCYEIRHEGNILILLNQSESHSSKTEYEVDSSDRLIRYFYESSYDDSEESKYSQFDDNGWPTFSINISWLEEEKTSSHITYKDIDEYGNWTRKAIDGEDREFRTITYYPID